MNAYIRPLLRFWWVLALGLCTAVVAGILVVDSASLGIPPKLKSRATPEFQADAQLIVDSAQGALFRTNQRVVTPQPDRIQYVCTKNPTTGKSTCQNKHIPVAPTVQDVTPNFNLLTQRANLYPSLIESSPFLQYRDKLYPNLPKHATMTSTALGATRSGGRIHASPVPIDVITVTAKTPKAAVTVANATLNAFAKWIVAQQEADGTPAHDRVVIRPTVAPTKAVNTTPSTTTLAALIAVIVFGLFVGLVFLLERAMPRREKARDLAPPPVPAPAPSGRRERERDDQLVGFEAHDPLV